MTINEGATHEINSRWPEYKQRNCGLNAHWYGRQYYSNMMAGIQLVRDHHALLTARGDEVWTIPTDLQQTLDSLVRGEI